MTQSGQTASGAYWSRLAAHRISRRRALGSALAAGAGAAALATVGCDDGGLSGDQEPEAGGALRFGSTLPPSFGLDPHVETGGALPVVARVYGYPHHADPSSDEILLDHLESFEQPDETTYVLRLRGDARFHDASPAGNRATTADDLILSMRRFRDSALTVNKYWHTKILVGEGATDGRTALVSVGSPYVYSMAEMGGINAGAIVPREVIDQSIEIRATDAGSGPLQLVASLPDSISLQRFAGYFGEAAFVAGMEWRFFGGEGVMADALRGRTIDLMPVAARSEADDLSEELNDMLVVREPSLSSLTIALRVDQPPFVDARVRQALDLMIDRSELFAAAGFDAGDARICGPVSPNLAGGFWALTDDEIEAVQGAGSAAERRSEATGLLSSSGAGDLAFDLQVAEVPALLIVAAALREQCAAAGITLNVRPLPILEWYQRSRSGDFTSTLIAHAPYETPDGALRWHRSDGPDGNGNPMHFANTDIDGAIDRARAERDRDRRREHVLEAQRSIIEQRAMLHLFTGSGYACAWEYVRDSGLELPGSLSRYHYQQWLALPVEGRPD